MYVVNVLFVSVSMYLCLHVSLTKFIQFAEVDLLPLAVLQVGVKCGAH